MQRSGGDVDGVVDIEWMALLVAGKKGLQRLLLSAIAEDIFERPFITIGMLAFVLLLAMAGTSTAGMRRRLGARWQKLHYSIYLVGALGVWHYWWQVKKDFSEPLVYALILAALLGYRVWARRARRPSPVRAAD